MALEAITNAPRSQKVILGVMVLALIGAGGYFLVLSPKRSQVDGLRGRSAALRTEIAQNRLIARNLEGFRQEAVRLHQRLEAVSERLPGEKEISTLYRQVTDLAVQTGLTVTVFQPKEPATRETYLEVPISVSAEAGFHQVGSFFDGLSRLPRIVSLSEIKIEGIERPTGSVKADLTLVTYLLRAERTPLPAAPKGRAEAKPRVQ